MEQTSDLGFHGAEAIHEALKGRKVEPLPSVRTINRILERRGALDGQRRTRRPAPPPGWHLPEVASKRRELDSFDVVEGLVIKDGPQVEVLNGVSLHGGLAASWPVEASVTAKLVVESLIEHWRAFGLPGYAQFDNDTIFQGTARPPRRDRAGQSVVPEPGGGPGVRRAPRVRLPVDDRELQRHLAGEGLGSVPARLAAGLAGALAAVRDRPASPPSRSHRVGPPAACLPEALALEPPGLDPGAGSCT